MLLKKSIQYFLITSMLFSSCSFVASTREVGFGTPSLAPSTSEVDIESPLTDKVATVNDFNDEGCVLPCFMNIVPGDTKLAVMESHINEFVDLSYAESLRPHNHGNLVEYIYPLNISEDIWISNIERGDYFQSYYTYQDNQIVQAIWAYSGDQSLSRYSLSYILLTFGVPNDVVIGEWFYPASGAVVFTVNLFYKNDGLLIKYSEITTVSEISNTECFITGPEIAIWNANEIRFSFEEADSLGGLYIPSVNNPYTQSDDALGLSEGDFFNKYKETQGEFCIEFQN